MTCDFCNEEVSQARAIFGDETRYKCKACQRKQEPKTEAPTIRIGPYSSPYHRDKM